MNDYDYKSAQSVDAATAKQETAPPLWDAERTMKSFKIPYGEEAPEEYRELISDANNYRVTGQQVHYLENHVVIVVWYVKKKGELPRKEKPVVKGFRDKNPDGSKYSTQA